MAVKTLKNYLEKIDAGKGCTYLHPKLYRP